MSLQTVEIEAFSGPTSVLIGGGNQPSIVYINQGPTGAVGPAGINTWGSITGTLSSQTDLQTALNAKASLSGATFTGTVNFNSDLYINGYTEFGGDLFVNDASEFTFETPEVSQRFRDSINLGNVNNTSDANKPVSTAQQTALNLKAPLASPTFTGIVTAPRITGRCDGLEVLCKAGLAINAGQVVYVTGASGNNIVIGLARANAEATSSKTLGISESTLANNATGYVITEGLMTVSISAPSANEGDPIWLSPTTAGSMVFGLANKPSAPNHIVYLGVVTRKTGNTVVEIYVKVQNGAELDELSDVAITSAVAGQALMRGATLWENRSLVIADISDATTSVPFLAAASNTFTGLASFSSTTRPTAPNVTGTPAATSLITRDDADTRYGTPYNLRVLTDVSATSLSYVNSSDTITLPAGTYFFQGNIVGLTASTTGGINVNFYTNSDTNTTGSVIFQSSSGNGTGSTATMTPRSGSPLFQNLATAFADAPLKACSSIFSGTVTFSTSQTITPRVSQRSVADATNAAILKAGSMVRFIKIA